MKRNLFSDINTPLTGICVVFFCITIVPLWTHASDSLIRRAGERIAIQCIQNSKEKVKTTQNTLFVCKDLMRAGKNNVAAVSLAIPIVLSAKEIALFLAGAAIATCKINRDCEQNAEQIVQGLIGIGVSVYRLTGSAAEQFESEVQKLFALDRIRIQLRTATKNEDEGRHKKQLQQSDNTAQARENANKKRLEELKKAIKERRNAEEARNVLVQKLKKLLESVQQKSPNDTELIKKIKTTIATLQAINFKKAYGVALQHVEPITLQKNTSAIINKYFPNASKLVEQANRFLGQ